MEGGREGGRERERERCNVQMCRCEDVKCVTVYLTSFLKNPMLRHSRELVRICLKTKMEKYHLHPFAIICRGT